MIKGLQFFSAFRFTKIKHQNHPEFTGYPIKLPVGKIPRFFDLEMTKSFFYAVYVFSEFYSEFCQWILFNFSAFYLLYIQTPNKISDQSYTEFSSAKITCENPKPCFNSVLCQSTLTSVHGALSRRLAEQDQTLSIQQHSFNTTHQHTTD